MLTLLDIGGARHLQYASTILCKSLFCLSHALSNNSKVCISFVLVIAVYVIYWKGPVLRKRSPFAQQLSDAREKEKGGERRVSRIPTGSRAQSFARSQQDIRLHSAMGSRRNSFVAQARGRKGVNVAA